jgi:hypothetical protein
MSLFTVVILCLNVQWVWGAAERDCVKEYESAGACLRLGFSRAPCRLTLCTPGKLSLKTFSVARQPSF